MILASSKSNSVMSAAETDGTSPIFRAIVFFDSLAPEAVPPPRWQILMRAGIRPFAVTFAALLRLVLIQWPSMIEKQDTGKDQSIREDAPRAAERVLVEPASESDRDRLRRPGGSRRKAIDQSVVSKLARRLAHHHVYMPGRRQRTI